MHRSGLENAGLLWQNILDCFSKLKSHVKAANADNDLKT